MAVDIACSKFRDQRVPANTASVYIVRLPARFGHLRPPFEASFVLSAGGI